jgi:hypothetical protein
MAVKLQLENGETKEYRTWLDTSNDPGYIPGRYVTKCGLKCDGIRNADVCNHVDCAMFVADNEIKYMVGGTVGISGIMVLGSWYFHVNGNELIGLIIFLGICCLLVTLGYSQSKRELEEFKERGTIKGLKAWKL